MRNARVLLAALALAAAPALSAVADLAPPPPRPPEPAPVRPVAGKPVDLVLCLDTSGSMQGLINAARQKMWEVVNLLGTAKPQPVLRVALLTYGTEGTEENGWVVLQTPFTTDLDLVSEKLFALGTQGGTEYVGRVVQTALDRLEWSKEEAVRILFVAGNESADQDRTAPFRDVVKRAAERGVRVNSIYCGNPDDADAPGWRDVAALGGGRYASIDHNSGTVAVATPFDKDLAELSGRLNGTYLGYGRLAREGAERQKAQDANAGGAAPAAAAERAASKAGRLYDNSGWDLVDKSREEGFDLAKVAEADLPEEMRKMTPEERKAHLEAKRREREDLQAKIRDLDGKRRQYVADEMAKKNLDDTKALDRALRDAVREQAGSAGLSFPESAPAPK